MNYYADNSVCELGAGAAVVLLIVGAIIFVCVSAWSFAAIGWTLGWIAGDPETGEMIGGVFGFIGVPILGVLGNGWRST